MKYLKKQIKVNNRYNTFLMINLKTQMIIEDEVMSLYKMYIS